MLTVVITGASGFVGAKLVNYLSKYDINVIPVSRQNLRGMYQVNTYADCPTGDILIHLAEEADRSKVNSSSASYKNEVTSIVATLSQRFERIIYASSGVVYGDKNKFPNSEIDEVKKVDLYSEIKLQNEQIILEQGGTVLRLSNIYGKGMSHNNVMSDILKQIPGTGTVKVRNSYPIRDFIYIDDLMTAFLSILSLAHNGILNIGSGEGISIYQLGRIILSIVEEEYREIYSIEPSTTSSVNVLNISKLNKLTQWMPARDIRHNLQHMIYEPQGINE